MYDAEYYKAHPQKTRDKIQKCLAEENLAKIEGDIALADTLRKRPECLTAITTKDGWNNYVEYCGDGVHEQKADLCDFSP
ncbi:MAG: hypothetical protein P8Q37_00460 [Porticoccaceae bacterium]|nr:hypothetical protein [Porticoccaceae bacterium]MDG1473348.1 hypothetical protein [Porticoccaceae bacterium]